MVVWRPPRPPPLAPAPPGRPKNRFVRRPVCAVHVVACTVHTQLCTERYKARSLGEGGTGAREAGQGRNKWSTIHSSDTGCSAQICVSHFAPTLNSGAGTVLLWEEDRSEKWVKKRGPAEKYKKYRKLNKWSRSRVNGSLILGRIVIRGKTYCRNIRQNPGGKF